MTKKIIIVWKERGDMLEEMRLAVLSSYKNNEPLHEAFSDIITYDVYETEKDIRLIIKFI